MKTLHIKPTAQKNVYIFYVLENEQISRAKSLEMYFLNEILCDSVGSHVVVRSNMERAHPWNYLAVGENEDLLGIGK